LNSGPVGVSRVGGSANRERWEGNFIWGPGNKVGGYLRGRLWNKVGFWNKVDSETTTPRRTPRCFTHLCPRPSSTLFLSEPTLFKRLLNWSRRAPPHTKMAKPTYFVSLHLSQMKFHFRGSRRSLIPETPTREPTAGAKVKYCFQVSKCVEKRRTQSRDRPQGPARVSQANPTHPCRVTLPKREAPVPARASSPMPGARLRGRIVSRRR